MQVLTETCLFLYDFLTDYVLAGFGVYSIVWGVWRFFRPRNENALRFDRHARHLAIGTGIMLLPVWITGTALYYTYLMDANEQAAFLDRLQGQYGYGIWLQPVLWLAFTQLLWIPRLRTWSLFRIAAGLVCLLPFEVFVIVVTQIHRDYMPVNWSWWGSSFAHFLLGISLRVFVFLLLTGVFFLGRKRFGSSRGS